MAHKWAGWLHNLCHLRGPQGFKAGDKMSSGRQWPAGVQIGYMHAFSVKFVILFFVVRSSNFFRSNASQVYTTYCEKKIHNMMIYLLRAITGKKIHVLQHTQFDVPTPSDKAQ